MTHRCLCSALVDVAAAPEQGDECSKEAGDIVQESSNNSAGETAVECEAHRRWQHFPEPRH